MWKHVADLQQAPVRLAEKSLQLKKANHSVGKGVIVLLYCLILANVGLPLVGVADELRDFLEVFFSVYNHRFRVIYGNRGEHCRKERNPIYCRSQRLQHRHKHMTYIPAHMRHHNLTYERMLYMSPAKET